MFAGFSVIPFHDSNGHESRFFVLGIMPAENSDTPALRQLALEIIVKSIADPIDQIVFVDIVHGNFFFAFAVIFRNLRLKLVLCIL